MKRKISTLAALLFVLYTSAFAQTSQVTFQVSNPSNTPVFVFGSWNWGGWPGTPMTPVGGGKYTATIALAQNTTHEYLFVTGPSPYTKEVLTPTWPCTNGNTQFTNRVLALGSADTGVCYTFATCNTCTVTPPPPPPTNPMVTFQVQSPDSTPVYIFGSWNWGGWPGTAMTSIGGGKYTATLQLTANTTHEFLFVNGNNPVKEILTPTWPCTNGNTQFTNRVLALGTADTGVCYTFATCNTCTITPPPPPPANVNVTFTVESPDSLPVSVFGSWNWGGFPGTPLTSIGNNKYQGVVSLQAGTTYEYLFVNGNTPTKEVMSPTASCTNGNTQFTNRVLNLGLADTSLCYTWQTCNACTAPPANVNMKLRVESPDSLPVYVFGSWSNWSNFPGTAMTSIGNNIYEATISVQPNTTYEYLFVNGNNPIKEAMSSTAPCTNGNTQFTNRVVNLGGADTTLCYHWQTCNACAAAPANVNITFQVQNPDSTPVYVFGSWSNWSNFPGTPLTLVSGNIYGATISMPPNATYEYLYVNGTSTKETLNPAWSCTNGNGQFTNRVLTVGSVDMTKCNKWELCDSCGQVTPTNINVKFAVQAPDSTPVYVFGSWSNWSNFPGTPMVFNSTLNRYEATIGMLANTNIEYLYVNGVGTKEALNPSLSCTNGNGQFTNRIANLGSTDTAFCNRWATCTSCGPSAITGVNTNKIDVHAKKGELFISSLATKVNHVAIYDVYGRTIFEGENVKTNTPLRVNTDANNIYIIYIKDGLTTVKVKAQFNN